MKERPSTRDDAVLQALSDLEGAASPADLAAATGLHPRAVTRALAELRGDGLVEGAKPRPALTATGRARARVTTLQAPEGRFDEAVETIFGPFPPLAAFCRLAADLVVARRLYEWAFHPSLLAYGRSGRGKTAVARLVALALGLGREAIVLVSAKAPGELVGRRVAIGAGRYRFDAAPHLTLPFLCLDELGEADAEVRREAQVLLQGDPVVVVEDEEVRITSTVMATWNPRRGAVVLADSYYRRALTFCTDAPQAAAPGLGAWLRDAELAGTGTGTLTLERYRPVAERLEGRALEVLRGLDAVLTEEGRLRVDLRLRELAVLGRAARYELAPGSELRGVAWSVGHDLLTVTETVDGLVLPWHAPLDKLAAELGDAPGFAELAAAASARTAVRERVGTELVARHRREADEDLELTGERARFVATVDQTVAVIKTVPPSERPAAAALRARLSKLRRHAGEARSSGALEEVIRIAVPEVDAARALRARLDEAKAGRDAELAQEKRERAAATRDAQDTKRAYERSMAERDRRRKADIRALRSRRAELVKLRKRRRVHQGVAPSSELVDAGVLRPVDAEEEVAARPTFGDVWRTVSGEPRQRRTRVVVIRRFVNVVGRVWSEEQLAAWGSSGVLAALDAEIAELDVRLTELEA